MAGSTTAQREFIPYPTNRVVGTIADRSSARAAIDALLQAGFAREDVDILHGEEDVRRLDQTGDEHGFLAQFQRTLLRTAAPAEEHKHLTVHEVRAGRFVRIVRFHHYLSRHGTGGPREDSSAEAAVAGGMRVCAEPSQHPHPFALLTPV